MVVIRRRIDESKPLGHLILVDRAIRREAIFWLKILHRQKRKWRRDMERRIAPLARDPMRQERRIWKAPTYNEYRNHGIANKIW